MKKSLLLCLTLVCASLMANAQMKKIKVNTRVSGSMITYSLYQKQADNSFTLLRSKQEDSGNWVFDSLPSGTYRVHQDIAYQKYLPTWHPRKALWSDAEDIDMSNKDSFICEYGLLPNDASAGPCSINGTLTEGLLKSQGQPLKQVRVLLMNGSQLVKMVSSNDSGKFYASSLPAGTYSIVTDIVNTRDANPKTVTVDSSHTSGSIELTVSSNGSQHTALAEIQASESLQVYPNPASDIIYINQHTPASYTICNLQGQVIQSGMVSQHAPVDISSLNKGLYLIRVGNASSRLLKY